MASRETIVTAADRRFHRTLCQLLLNLERLHAGDQYAIVAFDLGLTDRQRRELQRRFPWCQVRPFVFDRRPPHVRDLATFAWKPAVVATVLDETAAPVLWLDSATLVHQPIAPIIERIRRQGVFSLVGQTPLGRCCHPRTLACLDVQPADLARPYRAGGVLGFDGSRADIRAIVDEWRDRALDARCLPPPGADVRMHRWDQAIITALLYRAERSGGLALGEDEVDISSWKPLRAVSTRNKVPSWVPLACDPLVRLYYRAYKAVDRFVIQSRISAFQ